MRRAASFVGLLVLCGAACSKTEETRPDGTRTAVVTFSPSCGKAGDPVQVRLRTVENTAGCGTFEDGVTHSVRFHPGVPIVTLGVAENDGCVFNVTVPPAALTGKLDVTETVENNAQLRPTFESVDVFTIPCPPDGPDAGPGVDAGDSGPTANEPIGGVLHLRTGTPSTADAVFFSPPDSAVAALVETYVAAEELNGLRPPGVAVGSCGVEPEPNGPPAGVVFANAGNVVLRNGATDLLTMPPTASGTETVYSGQFASPLIPATNIDASVAGSASFPAANVPGAALIPAPLVVTSPDLTGGPVPSPQGSDLVINYTATTASHMTLRLTPTAVGQPNRICALDPSAGTFTVPSATLGGPGTVPVTLSLGNIVTKSAGGRRFLSVSSARRNFIINRQ